VLQKAAKRFQLHNPIEATDALWRAYSNNRLAAWAILKRDKEAEKEGYESPDSDDNFMMYRDDAIHVFRSIRRTMRELEDEMGFPDGLCGGFVLQCGVRRGGRYERPIFFLLVLLTLLAASNSVYPLQIVLAVPTGVCRRPLYVPLPHAHRPS
jgi:hypothetical protein